MSPDALRAALRRHADEYISAKKIPSEAWYTSNNGKTVLFRPFGDRRHGNFIEASYHKVSAQFQSRLRKPHSRPDALPKQFREDARELDSSTSSDALLMNIFCHPQIGTRAVCNVLRLREWQTPDFGVRYKVTGEREPSLQGGRLEDRRTELDITFGTELSAEGKLTEPDFTYKAAATVAKYPRLWVVFDQDALRPRDGQLESYQLIRNVLAADERGSRFLLVHDERRPDLLDLWRVVREAIRDRALRERCGTVTWQEIALAGPDDLREFLSIKYGIA